MSLSSGRTLMTKLLVESKELIAHAPVLCYFNPQLPETLHVDASGVGVGVALLQNDQPVAFYSNTLTETEQRYAVIEKECLTIRLAFAKWGSLCNDAQLLRNVTCN